MGSIKLVWNPFSAEARALAAEQRGNYQQALRCYAEAPDGEELAAERFYYGLPSCPIRYLFIDAVRALIQVERTALRISRDAGTPSHVPTSLTQEIEDAADDLWRRAHRVGHASAEAGRDVLDTLYEQERTHLQQLVQAIKAFHSELIHLHVAETSPLQDQAARFTRITDAARGLRQPADDGQ